MIFVKLDESNIEKYIEYLEHALAVEPEQMHVDKIDKEGLRERIKDSFFRKTTSVLAMENAKVLGRIEYHFYGCMQDGYHMAYIDWVYVLPWGKPALGLKTRKKNKKSNKMIVRRRDGKAIN